MGMSSPGLFFSLSDTSEKRSGLHLFICLQGDKDENVQIFEDIRNLSKKIPNGASHIYKSIKIYLSNGDFLKNEQGAVLQNDIERIANNDTQDLSMITLGTDCLNLVSNKQPKETLTLENHKVICQQLRTYDIVKIDIDGVSFNVRGLRSAATFDAMFNALAQKTGKGQLYRYNSSSSSSSVPSGPSASCTLGYIGVLTYGSILCRVDNLQIVGAKGKEARVCAIFEDVNDDSKICVFSKKLSTLPYDVCNYKSLRVKGDVNDYSMLSQYGSRRFKVTISVFVGDQSIYDSNVKYITIYNNEGDWYSR